MRDLIRLWRAIQAMCVSLGEAEHRNGRLW